MAGILKQDNASSGGLGAQSLTVRGIPYTNTAAKFWTCLIDELVTDYPPDTGVVLSAPTSGLLIPDLLTPEAVLQRDMDQLSAGDAQGAFEDALKALELIGPPCAVRMKLIAPDPSMRSHETTLDYLDAEILPFLLAWLLEWAGMPDVLWNGASVHGEFRADDEDRRLRYEIRFELHSRHLSEGLFDREVIVHFRREPVPVSVATKPPAG